MHGGKQVSKRTEAYIRFIAIIHCSVQLVSQVLTGSMLLAVLQHADKLAALDRREAELKTQQDSLSAAVQAAKDKEGQQCNMSQYETEKGIFSAAS